MTTQDLTDLKQLFEFAILTGDKPELTKSDCEMVVAAVDRVLKSEWIPVSERLPPLGSSVMVATSDRAVFPCTYHFDGSGWLFVGFPYDAPPTVTSWRPFPTHPEACQ